MYIYIIINQNDEAINYCDTILTIMKWWNATLKKQAIIEETIGRPTLSSKKKQVVDKSPYPGPFSFHWTCPTPAIISNLLKYGLHLLLLIFVLLIDYHSLAVFLESNIQMITFVFLFKNKNIYIF